MGPLVTEIFETDPIKAFAAVQHLPYSLLMDSADLNHPASRYSFIACYPAEMIETKNGCTTVTSKRMQMRTRDNPLRVLKERVAQWSQNHKTVLGLPPFQGGAAGLFGYDLGRMFEDLPSNTVGNPDMPDMAVGIYKQVIAFDHLKNRTWIITHGSDSQDSAKMQRHIIKALAQGPKEKTYTADEPDWRPNFDAFDYRNRVKDVIEYIKAGDIFQANISQRFDARLPDNFCAYTHYTHMRKINPAPFAAYMNLGDVKISSASPERFLTVKDQIVETRPIKGTRPRTGEETLDRVYRDELENSEKDKAENTMIVDLMRNDLSKVCTPQSVEVKKLCALESFASVHHLVSTVEGRLQSDKTPYDLLEACFPGGSITGAPKIRSMEIIEEMEPSRRGPYCGSIGYIGFDGTMDSNILIRTLVYDGNAVSFQTGGGITADSCPDQEYQETFDKAEAIFRSFEAVTHEIEEDHSMITAAETQKL